MENSLSTSKKVQSDSLIYHIQTCLDTNKSKESAIRRAWRYQKGNLNPYIEEEQTTQWQKKKNNYKRTKN